MIYLTLMCSHCDTEYHLEYDEENSIGSPIICPFCGEELEEELDENDVEDEEDDE
jgi:DNA-directed RNA polymerase subunit RPC12/RpoP